MKSKKFVWIAAAILLAGMISSCKELGDGDDIAALIDENIPGSKGHTTVAFTGVSADGGGEEGYPATALTLHFSKAITGLNVDHIMLKPVDDANENIAKVKLTGDGPSYTLYVSDVKVEGSGEVEVSVSNPTGYAVSGNPQRVTVYAGDSTPDEVEFSNLEANNDPETGVTNSLTLTFSSEIKNFEPGDIHLNPDNIDAEEDGPSGDGPSYTLEVSEIKKGGIVSVTVTKKGYAFKPTTLSVMVSGEDNNGSGETPGTEPPTLTKPPVIEDAANVPSIKAKFSISSEGTDAVTETFNTLSAFIKADGLDDGVIQLGDWIDLEGGLTVVAYEGLGAIDNLQNDNITAEDLEDLPFEGYEGMTLRLIVVGINSFKDKNGNGTTPHVVFQFHNVPVSRRMNPTKTNEGGYAASEMRTYVTGNFLAGLKNAGVPEGALWAPKRVVSVKEADDSNEISDLLAADRTGDVRQRPEVLFRIFR